MISRVEQLLGTSDTILPLGDSHAGRDPDAHSVGDQRRFREGQAVTLSPSQGLLLIGVRQQDGKLLAAVAANAIAFPANCFQQSRDQPEEGISHRMAVGVVDLLEEVHVNHGTRQRITGSTRPAPLVLKKLKEGAAIR
ncbi:MAG: hypothetical protein A2V98_21700 [Planctomycetes bacterium RBG_16_64_12]|nr:MAG: hypothetical protein A2V98_21700 [Planctomycetes bacterium RBG_16_64_12]